MPTFIGPGHRRITATNRVRSIGRSALKAALFMGLAWLTLWCAWVTATGYDDMSPTQQDQAAQHFLPDVESAFTFGLLHRPS